MITPKFGFSISPGAALGVGQEVAAAEAMGYARVGIWDSPALFREPWVTLASVARDTERIALGTWVTNPLTRHPVVTASAAATLDELAPGRVYIGIGAGDTGVTHLGLQGAKLAELEEYVLALRRLLQDGQAPFGGETVRLYWAKRRIPIIMAAHGVKSLRLAGRIADGVVIGMGITPEVIAQALDVLDQGASAAGRQLADIDVWFTSFWFVDPAPGVAQSEGAWAATPFVSHFARSGPEGKFVPSEFHEGLRAFGLAYDKVTHGNVPAAQKQTYVELAEQLGVQEYFQRRFVFSGTPAEVEEQVRAAYQAGATQFDGAIDAPLPEHRRRIGQWADLVMSRFATESRNGKTENA